MTQRAYNRVTVVALGKYPDIFESFDANLKSYGVGASCKVFVQDGLLIDKTDGWMSIQGPREFSMTGNANLGWRAADPETDILYIGDDVRFKQLNTIERLRELAYSDESIGMLSPKICGGADNPLQTDPPLGVGSVVYSERYLALVCTYIKRSTIDKVGYLDQETFTNKYGWDDVDYSRRVKLAGLRLAVAPYIEVNHGLRRKGTETFIRNDKGYTDVIDKQNLENAKAFLNKWGDNKTE